VSQTNSNTLSVRAVLSEKASAYVAFTKFRLASLVVFSASVSYFFAADAINWGKFTALVIGGFLVTGSSNGFNQIIEKDLDKLMSRTKNRPLPTGKMTINEGLWLSLIMGAVGISLLWFVLNPLSGLLGALALILYAGIYTPLKRKTSFAVFVGAFPGAIPPMLGYIAETGQFGLIPGILFAIQFVWQFPHFWAIAWKADDDYRRAGFHLLPSPGGKDKSSAMQAFVYAMFLIPISLLPFYFGVTGVVSAIIAIILGAYYAYYAFKLYKTVDDKAATKLMFASFVYLPVVQVALWLDKI
jgi:protoheme IX farnesyltransferase